MYIIGSASEGRDLRVRAVFQGSNLRDLRPTCVTIQNLDAQRAALERGPAGSLAVPVEHVGPTSAPRRHPAAGLIIDMPAVAGADHAR
jgi:hypothetical protein